MLKTKAFFDHDTNTVTYIVWETLSQRSIIIDPVLDYEPHTANLKTRSADHLLEFASKHDLTIEWVLDTHAHADHLSAADYLRERTGAKIGIGARITEVQTQFKPTFHAEDVTTDGSQFDALFEDGDNFKLGDEIVGVMHTPGHTPACVTYLMGDMAFVGDTLFMPDYGTARADFPGGDSGALYESIQRILALPEETRIMTGHDYLPEGRSTYAWEASVAEHRAKNVHIRDGVKKPAYVAMRDKRDASLKAPRLILPSLQINIRAGRLPPAAKDGHHYLQIPVNRI